MSTTTYKGYETQVTGSNAGTWGSTLNSNVITYIDQNMGAITTKSLTNADVTLSATESRSAILRLTGTISANIAITTACQGFFFVENLTTGSFTITVTNGVAGVQIPQSSRATVIADATNGCRIASSDGFDIGTVMMFAQTSAPTGWTKLTTHNNKALRIVSGTASTGGSVDFTTAFASQSVAGTVGDTTLNLTQIPAHTHTVGPAPATGSGGTTGGGSIAQTTTTYTSSSAGGGGSHTHTFTGTAINLAVAYVDVILAARSS